MRGAHPSVADRGDDGAGAEREAGEAALGGGGRAAAPPRRGGEPSRARVDARRTARPRSAPRCRRTPAGVARRAGAAVRVISATEISVVTPAPLTQRPTA